MDRLGQVKSEDYKGEAEGRDPTPSLSELRPYTGHLLEGWRSGGRSRPHKEPPAS